MQIRYPMILQFLFLVLLIAAAGLFAKNISKIPSLTYHQRDSLWAKFLTTEDSVPGGYWDILNKKTGGRNFKELTVQGPVQN